MKKAIVLLLSATVIFSLVGCGKDASATSSSSSTASETVEENVNDVEAVEPSDTANIEEDEQLNIDTTSEAETETQESEEEISDEPVANTSVNYEDYFDGNTWNLTAYAEALGYELIPDPEYEGLIMYAIENDGIKYFFCFRKYMIYIFFGDEEGNCWKIFGDDTVTTDNQFYTIVSNGQLPEDASMEMISKIASVMGYLKSDDMNPKGIPGLYVLQKCAGTVSYYNNGMIKQREFGDVIEEFICNNM